MCTVPVLRVSVFSSTRSTTVSYNSTGSTDTLIVMHVYTSTSSDIPAHGSPGSDMDLSIRRYKQAPECITARSGFGAKVTNYIDSCVESNRENYAWRLRRTGARWSKGILCSA